MSRTFFAVALTVSWMFCLCSAATDKDVKRFTLEKSMAAYHINDYGVPVTGQSSLLLKIKACQGVVFSLMEHYSRTTEQWGIEIGTGADAMQNSILDCTGTKGDCKKKGHTVKSNTLQIWKCPDYTSLWFKWTRNGFVSFGEGLVVNQNTVLSYKSVNSHISVNYIEVILLKDEHVQVIVYPNPNLDLGSLYLSVKEGIDPGTVLYTTPSGVHFLQGDNQDLPFELQDNRIALRKILDFEEKRYYVFNVSVTDGVTNKLFSVSVNVEDEFDEPPIIHILHDACRIPEELAVGIDVGKLFEVTDADVGDSFVYSLSGEHAKYLEIDRESGRVTMKARLDRDGRSGIVVLHHLQLKVMDKGNNSARRSLIIEIIDVNDNPPRFERPLYIFHVNPVSRVGAVGKLSCHDNDVYEDQGKITRMFIKAGNRDGIFLLKHAVLFADLHKLFNRSLLSNALSTHVLLIEAIEEIADGETENTTTVVMVKVSSPDDQESTTGNHLQMTDQSNVHAPHWEYPIPKGQMKRFKTVEVSENTKPGTVVFSVHAIDMDRGVAGQVVYSISPRTRRKFRPKRLRHSGPNFAAMYFHMDPLTGNLSVSSPLDRDKKTGGDSSYTVDIIASDRGNPRRSTTAMLRLLLINVNDNGPVFNQTLYKVSSSYCKQDPKKGIGSFRVTDPDSDLIKYVRLDPGSRDLYTVHRSGRVYSLNMRGDAEIDEQTELHSVITLSASDGQLVTTAKVVVHLLPCDLGTTVRSADTTAEVTSSSSLSTSSATAATTVLKKTGVTGAGKLSETATTTTTGTTLDGRTIVTVCKTTWMQTVPSSSIAIAQTGRTSTATELTTTTTSPGMTSSITTTLAYNQNLNETSTKPARNTSATLANSQNLKKSQEHCVCRVGRRVGSTRKKNYWKKCNGSNVTMAVAVVIPAVLVFVVAIVVIKKHMINRQIADSEANQQNSNQQD